MFGTLPTLSRSAGIPFKRASQGLFEGLTKQYGNNVPHSMKKTRRTWTPNVQTKRLFSETLGHHVKLSVTTRALRTIDKYGGLDGYLLGVNCFRLGEEGMRLRMLVKQKRGIAPVVQV
ncbi:Ribosomal L28 family [Rhizoctonia solani]|uniref:Large ribosomal subunit protein bL28c n=1 Tax=Rhizoctonia solani TaxID=456999 RepID=A0A8H7LRC7_9AGAM|nr:Ribosomal L28 family [Rhizoctonia solani]